MKPQLTEDIGTMAVRQRENKPRGRQRPAVAAQILSLRKTKGLSQRELAKRSHTSYTHISRLETGVNNPSVETLERVAEAMGMQLRIEFTE